MKANMILLTSLLVATPVLSQDFPYHYLDVETKCNIEEYQDKWFLEKDPNKQNEYLFTYINNEAECSNTYNGIGVVASDGFRVQLYVQVSYNDNQDEYIYVIPEDPQYMAYPPEIIAPDSSEPYTIRIFPGIM